MVTKGEGKNGERGRERGVKFVTDTFAQLREQTQSASMLLCFSSVLNRSVTQLNINSRVLILFIKRKGLFFPLLSLSNKNYIPWPKLAIRVVTVQ